MLRYTFILATIMSLLGCGNANEEALNNLQQENDSLRAELVKKDSSEAHFNQKMERFKSNISKIDSTKNAVKEALMNKNLSAEQKESIIAQMESVRTLILETDSMMDSLSLQTAAGGLKDIIGLMVSQIQLKKTEVVYLKTELATNDIAFENFDYHLELLSELTNEQAEVIKEQEVKLNECWYVIGSNRDLKKKDIIGREKGFLKLAKKLDDNIDKSYFTKADKRELTQLEAKGRKVKLATSHPVGSYKIVEGKNETHTLYIKDPKKFWATSKFLVIVAD